MEKGLRRDSVVFYRSFFEAIRQLGANEQAEIYDAIFTFALDGEEPDMNALNPVARAIFALAKPQILANNARYINGLKGGARSSVRSKKVAVHYQNATKAQPNVNDKENSNGNDNENVNGNENCIVTCDAESNFTCSDCARERERVYSCESEIESFLRGELDLDRLENVIEATGREDFSQCLEEFLEVVKHPWSQKNLDDLFQLDKKTFWDVFDKIVLAKCGGAHSESDPIENMSKYVWTVIARTLKEKN